MEKEMIIALKEFFNNTIYNDKIITESLEDLNFDDISWKNEELPRYGYSDNDYNKTYWSIWFGDEKEKNKDYLYLKNSALCYYVDDEIIFEYESMDIFEILSIIKSNHNFITNYK